MPILYRVENPITNIGLWYNEFGEKTDFIKNQIVGAAAAAFPMEPDPSVFSDGGNWLSACHSIDNMSEWFSTSDLMQFEQAGYGLYLFDVPDYRFTNGHAIFLREKAIEVVEAPIQLLSRGSHE